MAKPNRSPVLGYNHNVRYHGRVFHVQTEDSGPSHARVYTHLFFAGTILSSKKHEYDAAEHEDAVKASMQRLHKDMIKELTHGDHDQRIAAFFMSRGEPPVLVDPNAPVAPAVAAAVPVAIADPRADARGPVAVSGDIRSPTGPNPSLNAPVGSAPTVVVSPPSAPIRVASPPAPIAPTPRPRPMVVVKPGEVRRPPVVLSSSADGAVVQRNVVINVGGGQPPVNGERERGTRPRPAGPYVVRDGSYALPTANRSGGGGGVVAAGAGAAPVQPLQSSETQPIVSPRDVTPNRVESRTSIGRATVDPAARARIPGVPLDTTPRPRAPSERTPIDRAFSADLVSDKSLDEVILEYLSDDADSGGEKT